MYLPYLSYQNYDGSLPNVWRYTIQSIPIINKPVTINKHRYDIGRMLGKGAFGEVYVARRLMDGRSVAIKVVSLATVNHEVAEILKRGFLNEIQMSKRLAKTTKHIVHMYDFDFHPNGLAFIVMELGQQDLEKALSSRPRLSPVERKAMWRQLVSIAVTLQRLNIVHLDIKPSNLIMFPGNIVKLADLGIAEKVQHTRFGRTGTVPYSAPEVTQVSNNHVTQNSTTADIWSWGAVLYRMTYNLPLAYNYNPPCDRPPANQRSSHDQHLLNVLRHTLVIDPKQRPDASWLAQHPYTNRP